MNHQKLKSKMKPTSLKELFDCPARWIKKALFGRRGGMGFVSLDSSQEANCFCLVGGVRHVYGFGVGHNEKLREAVRKLFPNRMMQTPFYDLVVSFNNHPDTTFADLRKVIEEADV